MIQRTLIKDLPDRSRIVARLELREEGDRGDLSPAFSVTGDLYESHGTWSGAAQSRNGREADSCGCIHEEITRAFPELEPLIRLHLSDPAGVPMHAEANAYYFATDGHLAYELKNYGQEYVERHGTGLERAKRTLRVDEIPAGALESREAFAAFVDSLRPQWAEEARRGRAMLEAIPELYELRGYDIHGHPIAKVAYKPEEVRAAAMA